MTNSYLVIDIGTGNARVGLVSASGEVLCVQTKDTVFTRDTAYEDAWAFDPNHLFLDICSLIHKTLAQKPDDVRVAAVTATSARESIVLMDRQMQAFYGLPNIDNRGLEWQEQIAEPDLIYEKTGRWLSAIFSAMKLVGLRERRPELYRRTARITSISDWIGYRFTGVCAYEHSQACETQLLDTAARRWSPWLCERFQLPMDLLPDTVSSGTVLGVVSRAFLDEFGLPQNTPFVVSGADTQVAALGAGAKLNDMVVVSGTTSPVVRVLDHYKSDPQQRCWVDCHLAPNSYLYESNAGVTGLNYQRFKALFFPRDTYEEMDEQMLGRSRQKVMACFGTLIFKENRSLRNAGFALDAPLAADVDRFDFALAIANDIAFSIVNNYENHLAIDPKPIAALLGCGGGLQSRQICRTIATLTGRTLLLPKGYRQASLMGCAAICMRALRHEQPAGGAGDAFLPEANRDCLQAQYERWLGYRQKLNASPEAQ